MKVKVTEEKLYPIFKKFMETYFKNYKWRKSKNNTIWFISPDGYGYLELEKDKNLWIYRGISENILRYIPMEESMLQSLMGKWVGETFQIERINTIGLWVNSNSSVEETLQIEGINTRHRLYGMYVPVG